MGPIAYYIRHQPTNNVVELARLNYQDADENVFPVSMRDFIVEAVFYNPYGSEEGLWDLGRFLKVFRLNFRRGGYRNPPLLPMLIVPVI